MARKSPTGSSKEHPTRRRKHAPPIREGEWFAFPLHPRERGFAVGLAARVSPSTGILFGYFFGPARKTVPSLEELRALKPSDAIWLHMVGAMGLRNGEWAILGRLENWQRNEWPMPWLVHKDLTTQRPDRVTRYADEDILYTAEELFIRGDAPVEQTAPYEHLPEDSLAGHVYAEKVVSRLISEIMGR